MRAVRVGLDLAGSLKSATVYVVSVIDYVVAPAGLSKAPADAPDRLADEAATALKVAEELGAGSGIPISARALRGPAAKTILDFARQMKADVIVTGTHGRTGLKRLLMGSTCEHLLRTSEIPVLAVHSESFIF
jgi:nucleotide-binding universal stress UspA family protein